AYHPGPGNFCIGRALFCREERIRRLWWEQIGNSRSLPTALNGAAQRATIIHVPALPSRYADRRAPIQNPPDAELGLRPGSLAVDPIDRQVPHHAVGHLA